MEFTKIDEGLARRILSPKSDYLNKASAGKLGIIAGSEGICGAAVLSVKAALHSGSGYVTLAAPKDVYEMVFPLIYESTFLILDEKKPTEEVSEEILQHFAGYDALLVGCGIGKNDRNTKILHNIIKNWQKPLVLDADALNCICDDLDIIKHSKAKIIMTPHPGEMSRLVGLPTQQVISERHNIANRFASEYGITLVLKGFETVVASGGETLSLNNPNPGLAKAGSGDVLAGIIASFCAQGYSCRDSAVVAVFLHNRSAQICKDNLSSFFMQPSDVINHLSEVFLELGI